MEGSSFILMHLHTYIFVYESKFCFLQIQRIFTHFSSDFDKSLKKSKVYGIKMSGNSFLFEIRSIICRSIFFQNATCSNQ